MAVCARGLAMVGLCLSALLCTGCLHEFVNWSSGGELVWYCDKCEERVADPETHVCGMTRYNPETKKDELIDEADREAYEKIRAERKAARAEAKEAEAAVEAGTREPVGRESPRWMFWR